MSCDSNIIIILSQFVSIELMLVVMTQNTAIVSEAAICTELLAMLPSNID